MQKRLPQRGEARVGGSGVAAKPRPTWFRRKDTFREPSADKRVSRRIDIGPGVYVQYGKLIGEGGMGKVFLGRLINESDEGDAVIDKTVAVKIISFRDSAGTQAEKDRKELIDSFLVEVKLAAKLGNEHIVDILFFGKDNNRAGEPYVLMELLEGQSLDKRLYESQTYTLPWETVKPLMLQICRGLEAAHDHVDKDTMERQPIVHRDIKPANIFITKDSRGREKVKLLDFGLARTAGPIEENDPDKGKVVGTPEYMAPEQIRNKPVDHRTDIYALGAMMYELLSGSTPIQLVIDKEAKDFGHDREAYDEYVAEVQTAFLRKVLDERPRSLRENGWDIAPELDAIIMRCLEKDPDKRFQSVAELREAILTSDGDEVIDLDMLIPDAPPHTPRPSPAPAIPPQFIDPHSPTERRTSDHDVTGVYQSSRDDIVAPKKRPFKRVLAVSAVLLATTAIGSTVGLASYFSTRQPQVSDTARGVVAPIKPLVSDAAPQQIAEPIPEPMMRDAAPALRQVSVTIDTNVSNVTAFLDGEEVCRSDSERTCSFTVPHGSEPLTFTLSRPGFHDETLSLVPDGDLGRYVRMRRVPERTKPPGNGHAPRIISPD